MKIIKNKVATGFVLCALTAGMSGGAMASFDTVSLCKNLKIYDSVTFEAEFGNLGQCVTFFKLMPVEACQMLKEQGNMGVGDEYLWATQGDCVSDLMM